MIIPKKMATTKNTKPKARLMFLATSSSLCLKTLNREINPKINEHIEINNSDDSSNLLAVSLIKPWLAGFLKLVFTAKLGRNFV